MRSRMRGGRARREMRSRMRGAARREARNGERGGNVSRETFRHPLTIACFRAAHPGVFFQTCSQKHAGRDHLRFPRQALLSQIAVDGAAHGARAADDARRSRPLRPSCCAPATIARHTPGRHAPATTAAQRTHGRRPQIRKPDRERVRTMVPSASQQRQPCPCKKYSRSCIISLAP